VVGCSCIFFYRLESAAALLSLLDVKARISVLGFIIVLLTARISCFCCCLGPQLVLSPSFIFFWPLLQPQFITVKLLSEFAVLAYLPISLWLYTKTFTGEATSPFYCSSSHITLFLATISDHETLFIPVSNSNGSRSLFFSLLSLKKKNPCESTGHPASSDKYYSSILFFRLLLLSSLLCAYICMAQLEKQPHAYP
jgi:hypothetical protein